MAGEHVEMTGVVVDEFAGGKFKVELDGALQADGTKQTTLVTLSGKLRQHKIRVLVGDSVRLRFSPYDLNNGQIVYRDR